jgi:hypothetical protein
MWSGTEPGKLLLEFPDGDGALARGGEVGTPGLCPPPWVCPKAEIENRRSQEDGKARQRVNILPPSLTGDCNP